MEAPMDQSTQNQKKLFSAIAYILFSAIVTGSVVFFWQKMTYTSEKNELNQQIVALSEKLAGEEKIKTDLQEQIDALRNQIAELTKKPERYVKITSPQGDERVCLGDNMKIQWEHKGLRTIRLFIQDKNTIYTLSDATLAGTESGDGIGTGSFDWKVGDTGSTETLQANKTMGYSVIVDSPDDGPNVSDKTEKWFYIVKCDASKKEIP